MTDFEQIYQTQAEQYDQLIIREDYQENLLPAINQIRPVANLDVVESGAGTGRLTTLLAPHVKTIRAFDASAHMLAVAEKKLAAIAPKNWSLGVAKHHNLPIDDDSADLFIAGWTICYAADLDSAHWQADIAAVITEIKRVLRPGGTAIIIETQGTGFETPTPPEPLRAYFRYLETDVGFAFSWIRTDYHFSSLAEAEQLTRFFFGDALADEVLEKQWQILPECTGIWSQTF